MFYNNYNIILLSLCLSYYNYKISKKKLFLTNINFIKV